MDTNEVYAVLDQAKTAFEALSSTLRQVIGQMKDVQDENVRLNDANQALSRSNASQYEQITQLQNDVWATKRDLDNAQRDKDISENALKDARAQIETLKAEASKLREIILTVAAATDAIVNPKVPEVAKTPVSSERAQDAIQSYGSGSVSQSHQF